MIDQHQCRFSTKINFNSAGRPERRAADRKRNYADPRCHSVIPNNEHYSFERLEVDSLEWIVLERGK